MGGVKVSIRLRDGGLHEFNQPQEFLSRLRHLKSSGYEGRTLIHELLGDDWAAPPVLVTVTGADSEGQQVNIEIPYE